MIKQIITIFSIIISMLVPAAFAGASADTQGINNRFTPEEIISFSKKVERALGSKGARVAIVSRVGRDKKDLPDGIEYTHVAYWIYSKIKTSEGKDIYGYHVYNLYQKNDDPDVSDLVNNYPADFYSDVYALESAVIIPNIKLQKAIAEMIFSNKYKNLHNRNYSVVSNPENNKYQNCTEFILDTLMSAIYKTDDVVQIKANIKEYFETQNVKIGPIKRLLGSIFIEDFKTSDHKGKIKTTTYKSLSKFLSKYNLMESEYVITQDI